MKKIMILAAAAALMSFGGNAQTTKYEGNGTGTSTVTYSTDQENLVLRTVSDGEQQIYTRLTSSDGKRYVSLYNWLVDCLVKPSDFKGYITRNGVAGTAVEALPPYAQITNLFLTGKLTFNDTYCNGTTMKGITYIQDFTGDSLDTQSLRAPYESVISSLMQSNAFASDYTLDGTTRVGADCNFTKNGAVEDFYQNWPACVGQLAEYQGYGVYL